MSEEQNNEPMDGQETLNEQKETAENPHAPCEARFNELNDRHLRLVAEFENYKKRTQREKADLMRIAGAEVMKSVLPSIDDFERAIKANEQANDPEVLKNGFELIYKKLVHALQEKGLKKMEVIGSALDTDMHEAITQVPAPSEDMKGKIIDTLENGYFLNEVVIRYAKVVVGS